ncbi:DUF169 domain-containing protein [bacterium]|nr:DUF169 domain-containing protein [bacterium]MBU1073851.1 DUF169 domain-containing protein [bacterium]MBU1674493.1 DUF169 domain-containing protein [bacterium]
MESRLAQALNLRYPPVAILWTDDAPAGALQFAPGRWGCVMGSFAAVARKGKVAAFDRETFGCWGGGVGLGFGNCYENFPGGVDGFCGFLADGNERTEQGRAVAEACAPWLRDSMREHFLHGERYRKSADVVRRWLDVLPTRDVPVQYVVFKRLDQLAADEEPVVVVMLADADQMSGLVVLANYRRGDSDGAIIPHAAGCQSLGIFAYREADDPAPRAVVGLVDPSARRIVRSLGKDLVTVALPCALFRQMEDDVDGSFLQRETWAALGV